MAQSNSKVQSVSINNVILALFITLKAVSYLNPSFVWFSWWGVFLIPFGIQLLLIMLVPFFNGLFKGLGEKIGAQLYFRKMERTQKRVMKAAAKDAKAFHQAEMNK